MILEIFAALGVAQLFPPIDRKITPSKTSKTHNSSAILPL
jgi:hypothetical protein